MKADARIEGNCLGTICYLQGYSCLKLQFQESERSETYCEYSSQYKDKIISSYQTYFVFVPLFSKPILTRQIVSSTKNSQEFLASQVCCLKRNNATNSSTSNRPFFSCTVSPCTLINWTYLILPLIQHKVVLLILRTIFAVGFWLLRFLELKLWARIPLLIGNHSRWAVVLYLCVNFHKCVSVASLKVKFDHLFVQQVLRSRLTSNWQIQN